MLDASVETPITLRALDWVDDILSNKLPSCKRARQACKRFRADLKRAGTDQFPYVFDMEASEHICAFVGWTCRVYIPVSELIYAAFRSNAKGLLPPSDE